MSEALEAAGRSGLIRRDEPLLVMVSGGADSVCLCGKLELFPYLSSGQIPDADPVEVIPTDEGAAVR